MSERSERQKLAGLLSRVRRRIFLQHTLHWCLLLGLIILPLASVAIACDQRWNGGRASVAIGIAGFALLAAVSIMLGIRGLGRRVRSALTLDQQAHLHDRVSSAWEFLQQPSLSEAQLVQIHDAIDRAEALDCGAVLRLKRPRFALALPLVALLFLLSFFVPPIASNALAHVGKDPVKEAQLELLEELRQDLMAKEDLPEELQDVLKKLEDVRRQFEQGEIGERDVMLELGRLDENLRSKLAQIGVENLESEMNAIVPHLSANAATLQAAQAMKEKQFDKAAEELQKLSDKIKNEELSKEDQKKLAAHLGAAAAKLGKKSGDSFGGDLADASESLEKSDCEGFNSACQSMGKKLGLLSKCQGLKSACSGLSLCKLGMGQCNSKEMGYKPGLMTQANSKGGLKAGTAASGNPFGDPNRLADSYKQMLQISGQAGQGPVETETEITDGQMSQSQLNAREVHSAYAAVAEEVIEREDIPLSHRYHVKRYFQAIRPAE